MNSSNWTDSISAQAAARKDRAVRLFDLLFGWIDRARERRALAKLDCRMLADIGVTRADAETEADKPFWHD